MKTKSQKAAGLRPAYFFSFSTKTGGVGRFTYLNRLSPAYKMHHEIYQNSINKEVMVWVGYKKSLGVRISSYNRLLRSIVLYDDFEIFIIFLSFISVLYRS